MNSFVGTGIVGTKPELRAVQGRDGERQVCHFRFYNDHRVPDGKGGYVDQGGMWFRVTVWGRWAEHVARVIDKGMLVQVIGTVYEHHWVQKDTGLERSELRIDASRGSGSVTLVLLFVDQVQTTPRQGKPAGLETGTEQDEGQVPLEPLEPDMVDGPQESALAQSATSKGTRKGGRRRAS